MSGAYGPSIELCKLWSKTSKSGTTYLVGRLAGARITVLPNRKKLADTDHDYVVLLSQADQQQAKQTVLPLVEPPAEAPIFEPSAPNWHGPRRDDRKRAAGGGRSQLEDDVVPFGVEAR